MPFRSIAADIYNRDRGTNLLNLASLTGAMGTIYRNSDNAARAVELFKEEIGYVEEAIAAGMIEAHDEKLAIAYEHMAVATQQLGNYEEAAEWHTKNLDILLKYYKEDQVNIALAYVNQSWSLWKMGKLDDASRTLEWVLQTAQTALECNPQDFQAARA
jgi:tetratricopeptide (TPR) repeat protein